MISSGEVEENCGEPNLATPSLSRTQSNVKINNKKKDLEQAKKDNAAINARQIQVGINITKESPIECRKVPRNGVIAPSCMCIFPFSVPLPNRPAR